MADVDLAALASPDEEGFVVEPSTEIFASEENKQALMDYIAKEVDELSSDSGRTVRMERNEKIRRQRLARPEEETKDFPWEGASNVTPPMALQKTNTVVTKMMASLLEKTPLFTYEADAPYTRHAEAVTRHVQKLLESPYAIDFYAQLWSIIYDACSLGTKFVKVPFSIERMRFNRIGNEGTEAVDKIIKATPDVKPIPFEDFMTRPEWHDLQKAPWCGVRYYKYAHELKALAQQGYFQNVDQIITETGTLDVHKQAEMENMGTTPSSNTDPMNYIYEIYECNVFWDADGDGFDEDIIVTFEKATKTILRAEYNDLGVRDYVRLPYIDIPDQLYALGVGEMLISLQDEVEAQHNMRNNATAMRLSPVVITSEASDLGEDQYWSPAAIWKSPTPREDFNWFQAPDVGQAAIQSEQMSLMYADRATGASQTLSGGDVGGSNRVGATGTQYLGAQSNGFLDSIAVQLSHALPEIAMLILYQLVRNSDLVVVEGMSEADQILLNEVYSMNVEEIPGSFKFRARLSSIEDSKQLKQQAAVSIFQLYSMYGDKATAIAAQLANPQLAQTPQVQDVMMSYMVGLTTLMDTILKNFDEDNVGDYLPFVEDLKLILRSQDQMKQQEVDSIEAGASQRAAGQTDGALPGTDPTEGAGGTPPATGAEPVSVQGTNSPDEGGTVVGGEPI